MTTQEYVKKYSLNVSDKFNHSDFVEDLASDLIALLEINKAKDNIKGFDNALRCVRMKFDAINNKTVGEIPEKLWKYFYATVVVKLRDEICPRESERRREEQEQKKKDWEQRKAFRDRQDDFWSWNFYSFLFSAKKSVKPLESFSVLGLSDGADENDVKSAYKKLALTHHPDRGGKQEAFVGITEAKNKCLAWLDNNK